MKPLNMLSKIWKSFCNRDRPFSSSTWSGRLFFCTKIFEFATAARRNRRIYYPPLSSAPFAVLECTATNAPNERKMAHPINLSLITVASTARCNVGKNAISTNKFRKKFWTTPWWRLGCLPKRTPPVWHCKCWQNGLPCLEKGWPWVKANVKDVGVLLTRKEHCAVSVQTPP